MIQNKKIQALMTLAILAAASSASLGEMFYAVDDNSAFDSQLVSVDYTGGVWTVTDIGPEHLGLDIEGIDFHPVTDVMYAVGGEGGVANDKFLYTWDIVTGAVTTLGQLGGPTNPFAGEDVVASGFRWSDHSYWISVHNKGLYTVDLVTLAVTLKSSDPIFSTTQGAEALTWSLDSQRLMVASDGVLYEVDVVTGVATSVLTIFEDTEGLGYDNAGNLLATSVGATTFVSDKITRIDYTGGVYSATVLTASLPGSRDLESIANIVPEPATMSLLALGGMALIRRRRKA
ncbi:MAG: PEP-CTERM sorting domain-containing protein [Planctomycetota bacterium]|jgi:hypothetical protein